MREIVFEVDREAVDAWSDALLEAGALAVQAEDADADSPDEQPLFGEPGHEPPSLAWERTRLAALVDDGTDPPALLADAAAALGLPAPAAHALREVPDQDWVRLTQSQFEPIPVGARLVIAPSWHDVSGDGRIAIEMDPGLAFGTGSHPTTHLCLEWLDANLRPGARVIDYGCGSGILAIAALKLGASAATGIDIDPQALVSARDNAARNRVVLDVQGAGGVADLPPADVVVANILSNPLKLLAPVLASLVAPGGALVLSGVLARQADEVAACYTPFMPMTVAAEREGWVCLAGRRAD